MRHLIILALLWGCTSAMGQEEAKKPTEEKPKQPVTIVVNNPGPIEEFIAGTGNIISSIIMLPLMIPMSTTGSTFLGAMQSVQNRELYYYVNHASIMKDISKGGGEFLEGFNQLLGMRSHKWTDFLKDNLASLCQDTSYKHFVEVQESFKL